MPENDALVQVVKMHPEILQVNNFFREIIFSRKTPLCRFHEIFNFFLYFQQMLSTVLNIIMFEDCRNQVRISFHGFFNDFTIFQRFHEFFSRFFQWSMSRPLLGLVLLNEDYFESLRDQVNNFTKFS